MDESNREISELLRSVDELGRNVRMLQVHLCAQQFVSAARQAVIEGAMAKILGEHVPNDGLKVVARALCDASIARLADEQPSFASEVREAAMRAMQYGIVEPASVG